MTRAQFLNDLYHYLRPLGQEQAEQHLTYYAEMLADRMEEGMTEDEAVAGMEDVETRSLPPARRRSIRMPRSWRAAAGRGGTRRPGGPGSGPLRLRCGPSPQ